MSDRNSLFSCLNIITPISKDLTDYLVDVIEPADYKKGSLLLRGGTVCRQLWWLRKGLVRFFYHANSHDVSHSFIAENNFILALRSLYDQQRSKLAIQAVEDCVTWYVDYSAVDYIYKNFPEAQIIGRATAEQYYAMLELRLEAIALKGAVERYRFLETYFPDLLQRVPLKHLASFLDLEVHTISRIRKGR